MISPRASKLYSKICSGRFYRWSHQPSALMKELIDAGLIVAGGRVASVVLCWVPQGTKPLRLE